MAVVLTPPSLRVGLVKGGIVVQRKIVAVFADTHGGSKLGLMPPGVQLLDDTGPEPQTWTPQPTAIQKWLWGCYQEDMAAVVGIAGKSPIVLVHAGDLTQGTRYPEACVSARAADHFAIGMANLEPWYALKNLRSVCLVQGTSSHEFGDGSAPTIIGGELSKRYKRVNTFVVKHGLLNIDGARMDVAHHGAGTGGRAWLTGNELRYYTRSVMLDEVVRGNAPPAALVRAHYHSGVRETVRVGEHVTEAFVMPCYCGLTHYAVQVTRSAYLLSCGMVALVFEGGKLVSAHTFWRSLDLRQEVAV